MDGCCPGIDVDSRGLVVLERPVMDLLWCGSVGNDCGLEMREHGGSHRRPPDLAFVVCLDGGAVSPPAIVRWRVNVAINSIQLRRRSATLQVRLKEKRYDLIGSSVGALSISNLAPAHRDLSIMYQ